MKDIQRKIYIVLKFFWLKATQSLRSTILHAVKKKSTFKKSLFGGISIIGVEVTVEALLQ